MHTIELSREQLYKLVWASSLKDLAKTYKITETELRLLCVKMLVPVPSKMFWKNAEQGIRQKSIALPATQRKIAHVSFKLRRQPNVTVAAKEKMTGEPLADSLEEREYRKIRFTNKLILAAQKSLTEKNRYLDKGLARTYGNELDMKVSPELAERALTFMHILIDRLILRGHSITPSCRDTRVTVQEMDMKILLRERVRKSGEVTQYGSPLFEPSGELYFKLDAYPSKEWKDGRLMLEEQMENILDRLELQGKELLESQIARKKRQQEEEAEEKKRKAREAMIEQELVKTRDLLRASEQWQKVRLIRRYLADLEEQAVNKNMIDEEMHAFLQWANQKADWLDPLVKGVDEMLQEYDPQTLQKIKKPFSYSWD